MNNYNNLINIKNFGIVTILCAATATTLILVNKQQNEKQKQKKAIAVTINLDDPDNIEKMVKDLQSRREEILEAFERSDHSKIPSKMNNTMKYLSELEPDQYPNTIRLLASQLIQDFAIMYTNIYEKEPESQVIQLAKGWLDFIAEDGSMQVEQINHKYALALRSRNIKEFKSLYDWLKAMDSNEREKDNVRQNWILRCFQCACLLGNWEDVKKYGRELEKIEPESLATQSVQQAPLHPLYLFEYIALKLPNQSANFTQVYYNVDIYKDTFDPRFLPPLKFCEWQIRDCTTQLTYGFSTTHTRNIQLQKQIESAKSPTKVPSVSRFMFVYGCLVQFPCYWVQLPASNAKMQPVVLTGPWNDTEMELTAAYIRRIPQPNSPKRGLNGAQQEDEKKDNVIQVVRSDLRLRLDRKEPYIGDAVLDDNKSDSYDNSNNNNAKKKKASGWNWKGTFEHNEGVLEIKESLLNDFSFRRNLEWKQDAIKFTCRTWNIHMVIGSPD